MMRRSQLPQSPLPRSTRGEGTRARQVLLAILTCAARAAEPDLSQAPGVVIDHSPASSKSYIGSPSLAVLPDGTYEE